jgi:CubicO group peptidase (beta-lactamase class C family)
MSPTQLKADVRRERENHMIIRSLILIATICCSVFAQSGLTAKVDEYVQKEMKAQRIPGLALAVMNDGQITYAKGYGFANLEHSVPVKPETIFQSGSVGKQFTAAAIMLLVEDGKLGLDDSITKYFKDSPAAWNKITIRHLLTHTAGTTDYPTGFDMRRDWTEDELFKQAAAIPLAFQPGEKWSYSNIGYVMLGILISKVTGKFYGEFLQERIFKPLGMTTARIINESDIIPNRSSGYRLLNGEIKHQEWVAPLLNTTADGSLYLTVYDLAKWDAALYGEKLLKRASLDQIWTRVKLNNGKTANYGFGWALMSVNNRRLIEHSGSWQGFKAQISRYVDDKLTVVVLANAGQSDPERIAHGIAGIINPALVLSDPQVTALLKTLLQQLADGTAKPEHFTPEFAAQLFPNKAKEARESLQPLGALLGFELLSRKEEDGYRQLRYRLRFAEMKIVCKLLLKADDKIMGLELQPE